MEIVELRDFMIQNSGDLCRHHHVSRKAKALDIKRAIKIFPTPTGIYESVGCYECTGYNNKCTKHKPNTLKEITDEEYII